MSITPFKIDISEHRIEHLRQKLALSDFPTDISDPDDAWHRGTPLSEIKRLAAYWQTHFDWQKVEMELNGLPQYTVQINVEGFGTYEVHLIHQASDVVNAIPLLFLHGWPGSFLEVTKILSGLVNSNGLDFPAFHVVAPSLIGFGFSSASIRVSIMILIYGPTCAN